MMRRGLGAWLLAWSLAGCSAVGQVVSTTEQPTPIDRQVAPPVAVVTPPPIAAVPASSRAAPLKLGASGSLNGLKLRVTKVAVDATKVATQRLYPEAGNRYVAVKMTVSYSGSDAWGFSGLLSLKAVGKSGVVYNSSDMGCLLSLPKSDLINGVTVMGVPSLSGWAACWQVKKSDVASLETFYDPPFASFNNEPRPQIWFALH